MNARFVLERRKSVNPEAVHTIIEMNPAVGSFYYLGRGSGQ